MTIVMGCWAKFAERELDLEPIEREGYMIAADYQHGARYEWVCPTCFADFREAMGWTEA